MKQWLTALFSPILGYFESLDGDYAYKPSHRRILIIVGGLFIALSIISFIVTFASAQLGGLLPALVFLAAGAICEIVGWLGSDKAVAKIWKSR